MKPLPMKRWMAEITYLNGRAPDIVTFEEIGTPCLLPRASGIRHLIEDHGVPEDEASAIYDEMNLRIAEARREPSLADIIETGATLPDGGSKNWNNIDQIVITLNRPVIQPRGTGSRHSGPHGPAEPRDAGNPSPEPEPVLSPKVNVT